jgi:hypothetical protein
MAISINGVSIDGRKLSKLENRILAAYQIDTRGHAKFLTNAMCKAILSDAMFYTMLEDSREASQPDTVENYVSANLKLHRLLEL